MKRFSWLKAGALVIFGLAAIQPVLKADQWDRKTVISISQPLEVPGVVLPPGKYVMKLFNSSSSRHIVQIMNEDQNQQLALTFTASAERLQPTDKTLLTMYEGSRGAPAALRTWFYPGDTIGQEFLYPHNQAVRISERTNVIVPQVETASVTESPSEPLPSDRSQVLIARAEPAPEPAPAPIAAPEPQQPATEPQAPPVVSTPETLPDTAGTGPLAGLIGALSFAMAFGLRRIKQSRLP